MAPDPRPEVFAAIAHPVRRRILDLLAEDDRPVNALASHFDVSRPAVSQHLRVLLDAGLVTEQRHGRERRYRLVPEELATIYAWLAHYERFWKDRFQSLSSVADQMSGEQPGGQLDRHPDARPDARPERPLDPPSDPEEDTP
jgi:DNA-binding transcriptional ArsR family regulator